MDVGKSIISVSTSSTLTLLSISTASFEAFNPTFLFISMLLFSTLHERLNVVKKLLKKSFCVSSSDKKFPIFKFVSNALALDHDFFISFFVGENALTSTFPLTLTSGTVYVIIPSSALSLYFLNCFVMSFKSRTSFLLHHTIAYPVPFTLFADKREYEQSGTSLSSCSWYSVNVVVVTAGLTVRSVFVL